MKYTIEMKMYCTQYDDNGLASYPEDTSVEFDSIPEPITVDDLLDYFIRFAEAAGYMRQSVIDTMYEVAMAELPDEKLE